MSDFKKYFDYYYPKVKEQGDKLYKYAKKDAEAFWEGLSEKEQQVYLDAIEQAKKDLKKLVSREKTIQSKSTSRRSSSPKRSLSPRRSSSPRRINDKSSRRSSSPKCTDRRSSSPRRINEKSSRRSKSPRKRSPSHI